MFTGIVQFVRSGRFDGKRIIVENPWFKGPNNSTVIIGESIAVNGVCLTVIMANENLHFDVGDETLKKTNLSTERYFNLERALRLGDSVSGHYVTGHVDGTLRFISKRLSKNSIIMTFKKPDEQWAIVPKGSITLNGVSLTISNVFEDTFEVQIIPHTFENTNLKYLSNGSFVNYEIDVFARYMKGVFDSWKRDYLNKFEEAF
ncbi:riboflavin synthase [Fervidobacterium sp.]